MKPSMTATLTVRLPKTAAKRVRARASAMGITPSDLVRAALEREIGKLETDVGPFEMTKQWIGRVRGRASSGRSVRKDLARWNPDRRG